MDLHRSYLATTCRICTEVIASSRTYTICSVSSILQDVYKDKDGCDVSKDNADTESKNVCNRCYTMLVRWNADHQKFLLHKRKNPNSTKEFSSSSKLPPSIENPFVHLENGCLCSAGKIDDTAEKSDTDEDKHEASRAGDNVDDEGCTPSKLQKLSLTPIESPSDKLTIREQRKNVPVKRSIKFAYSKAVEDKDSGEVL